MLGPAGKTKNDVTTGEGMPIVKDASSNRIAKRPKVSIGVGQHSVESVVWKVLSRLNNRCSRELGVLRYGVRVDTKEA
jgi:hypothetical protein